MANLYHKNGVIAWNGERGFHENSITAWIENRAYYSNGKIAFQGKFAYHKNGTIAWNTINSFNEDGSISGSIGIKLETGNSIFLYIGKDKFELNILGSIVKNHI